MPQENEAEDFTNFDAGPEDMILTNDFETWLSQLNSSSLSQTYVDQSGFLISTPGAPLERAGTRFSSISLGSSAPTGRDIPENRFERVEKCWFHNSGNHSRVMHSLWKDVSLVSPDNVLAGQEYLDDATTTQELSPSHLQCHSRRGLKTSCWERLEKMFNKAHRAQALSPCSSRGNLGGIMQSPQLEDRHDILPGPKFPPVEILDMALDLYFRHFHPLLPFIHVPTFDPKVFDEPTLFTMCLIGLTLINTHGAKIFVQQAFDVSDPIRRDSFPTFGTSQHAWDTHIMKFIRPPWISSRLRYAPIHEIPVGLPTPM
ncbi:hypothetical protein ACEPPN_010061 [Leptodophora sp. 'Broadleaf-Isolate-01']